MRKFGIVCAVLVASMAAARCAGALDSVLDKLPQTAAAPLSTSGGGRTAEYLESLVKSAQSALRAGMPALAQAIAEDSVDREKLPPELAAQLKLVAVDAMIAQGDFANAEKLFTSTVSAPTSEVDKLRSAMIDVGLSKTEDAAKTLGAIDETKLDGGDRPWYFIARGFVAYERGNISAALADFKRAKESAKDGPTVADAEIAEIFCRIIGGDADQNLPSLAKTLEEKTALYLGTPQGFQFAKQYAAVLYKMGEREKAIDVLNTQLGIELAPSLDRDELKIVVAAMTKSREKQLAMLRDILLETNSASVGDFALALLAHNPDVSAGDERKFLLELLEKGSEKIRDRIYLELAKSAVKSRDKRGAAQYAGRLVDEYPASKYRSGALRILAWTAFSSEDGKEPEYRLAATHLAALADLEKDPEKAREMRLLSADCLFLNKDYTTAAKIYTDLFAQMRDKRGMILNRAVESYLNRNETDSAIRLLDSAYDAEGVGDDDLWNSEWKLISHFRSGGREASARARIEHAIKTTRSKLLLIKMQWFLARITEESGDSKKAAQQCDKILSEIESLPVSDGRPREILASNALLMKARCLEDGGGANGDNAALEAYKLLREKYPSTDAAKISYLYQARNEAARGNFGAAQQLCRTLADADPKGAYAYDAISDAAQYARKLGLESDYKSALAMLDKLCKDFPDNPRNFYARLSQAEILRLLNAFADARKLYEEILNKYQSHPEIYLAWLGLGDCALAQQGRALNAVAIFERLYALPEMPVSAKAEAAFKCAYALERAGRNREANEMRWVMSQQLLAERGLTAAAKYWLGRTLYSLASNLEKSGAKRDARAAYELIIKHALPSSAAAKSKLAK